MGTATSSLLLSGLLAGLAVPAALAAPAAPAGSAAPSAKSAPRERVILTERTSASSATRALAAARAAAAAADAPASEGPLRLLRPADGIVTSGFGWRGSRPHHGIDYGMLRSLAIRSASAGEIIGAGYLTSYEGYGMVVVVDLGDGHTLIYSHLTRVAVATGDTVEPGDPIGTAGCTGVCYGTHLHFELRRNGKPIDPTPYIVAAR